MLTSSHTLYLPLWHLSPQRENLYVEVLYTVKHKVGATTSQHSSLVDELNDYAQEAFRFSRDMHQKMMTIASDEKVSWTGMQIKKGM